MGWNGLDRTCQPLWFLSDPGLSLSNWRVSGGREKTPKVIAGNGVNAKIRERRRVPPASCGARIDRAAPPWHQAMATWHACKASGTSRRAVGWRALGVRRSQSEVFPQIPRYVFRPPAPSLPGTNPWSFQPCPASRRKETSMRRFDKSKWLAISLLAALAGAWSTNAALAAGILTPVGSQQSLAIESQKIDVHINNGVAVTTVTQVFRNSAAQPLEALYTFPVPREASVSNFSMWINGKEVIGEVLERQQARQIYQQVTRVERKDPGLLEQVDYKTFE